VIVFRMAFHFGFAGVIFPVVRGFGFILKYDGLIKGRMYLLFCCNFGMVNFIRFGCFGLL